MRISAHKHIPLSSGPPAARRARVSGTASTLGDEADLGIDSPATLIRVTANYGSMLDVCKAAKLQIAERGYRMAPEPVACDLLEKIVTQPEDDDHPRPKTPLVYTTGENGQTVVSVAYSGDPNPMFADLEREHSAKAEALNDFFLVVLKKKNR